MDEKRIDKKKNKKKISHQECANEYNWKDEMRERRVGCERWENRKQEKKIIILHTRDIHTATQTRQQELDEKENVKFFSRKSIFI